ncbi:11844_t:CDS:2 [Funneliformis geosporum]|uniref:11844_t:CDS:1 n=1 Tax=Funneliformis geosporum TaxID=1117311 RepID=A0A9W4WRU9_9GLOM|nr:11844_t:CDS:2 [Funneliformis geosporum]
MVEHKSSFSSFSKIIPSIRMNTQDSQINNDLFTDNDKEIIYNSAKDYLVTNRDIKWKSIKTKIKKDPGKFSLNDMKNVWNSKQRQLAREARAEVQDEIYLYDPSNENYDNNNYTTSLNSFYNFIQKLVPAY